MPKPIEPPHPPRRGAVQELRSQLALELALHVYAAGAAAVALRGLLLSLGVTDRLWIGATIIGTTEPLARVLAVLPGADRLLVGRLTLADATLVAGAALAPLAMLARPAPHRSIPR